MSYMYEGIPESNPWRTPVHSLVHEPARKSEPRACSGCPNLTRHLCPVCKSPICADCTLADWRGRCDGCR